MLLATEQTDHVKYSPGFELDQFTDTVYQAHS